MRKNELECFIYEYNKACDLGESYLLPKIQKRLSDIPEKKIVSWYGELTGKVPEFSENQLLSGMWKGKFYIRVSGYFLEKTENINAYTENTIIVTAVVVGLYSSIVHHAGLCALSKALDSTSVKHILK